MYCTVLNVKIIFHIFQQCCKASILIWSDCCDEAHIINITAVFISTFIFQFPSLYSIEIHEPVLLSLVYDNSSLDKRNNWHFLPNCKHSSGQVLQLIIISESCWEFRTSWHQLSHNLCSNYCLRSLPARVCAGGRAGCGEVAGGKQGRRGRGRWLGHWLSAQPRRATPRGHHTVISQTDVTLS